MDIKRALLSGFYLWVLIFFEVSFLMFGFKLTEGTLYYTIHGVIVTLLIILTSLYYFGGKVKTNVKEGFLLGLILVIVGLTLDNIITVPLFVEDWTFSIKPEMFIGYLGTIVIATIVGVIKSKQTKKH